MFSCNYKLILRHSLSLSLTHTNTHTYLLEQPLCQGSHDLGLDPRGLWRRCVWLLRPSCLIDESSIMVIFYSMSWLAFTVASMMASRQNKNGVNMWWDVGGTESHNSAWECFDHDIRLINQSYSVQFNIISKASNHNNSCLKVFYIVTVIEPVVLTYLEISR